MKTLVLAACVIALPLGIASARAPKQLSDAQMDWVSAGATGLSIPSCEGASACGSVVTTSTSSTTTTTNSQGVVETTTVRGGLVTVQKTISGLGNSGTSAGSGTSDGTSGGGSVFVQIFPSLKFSTNPQ